MAFRQLLACALAGALALPAQTAGQNSVVAQNAGNGGLKIVVIEGEGARNSISSGRGVAPVVEVRDDQDKPVTGASVTFEAPVDGASANFFGWLRTQTVKTDAKGIAAASGYTPNSMNGKFQIKVMATMATKSGSAVVTQTNANGPTEASASPMAKPSNKTLKILAVLGAAAIAGGVAAKKAGGGSTAAATPTSPVTITSGPVTVAGPR